MQPSSLRLPAYSFLKCMPLCNSTDYYIQSNNLVFEDVREVIRKFLGIYYLYVTICYLGQFTNGLDFAAFTF